MGQEQNKTVTIFVTSIMTRLGKARQDKTRHKTRHDKARQDKTRQDRAGQDMTGQGRAVKDRRQDRTLRPYNREVYLGQGQG